MLASGWRWSPDYGVKARGCFPGGCAVRARGPSLAAAGAHAEALSSVTALLPPPWVSPVLWVTIAPSPAQALQLCQGALGSRAGSCFACGWMNSQPRCTLLNRGLWWLFPQGRFPEPEELEAGEAGRGQVSGVEAGSHCPTAAGTGCVLGGAEMAAAPTPQADAPVIWASPSAQSSQVISVALVGHLGRTDTHPTPGLASTCWTLGCPHSDPLLLLSSP